MLEISAKCLLRTWALSKGCIFIWLSLRRGGEGLFLFLSFVISLAILYHAFGFRFGSLKEDCSFFQVV